MLKCQLFCGKYLITWDSDIKSCNWVYICLNAIENFLHLLCEKVGELKKYENCTLV